MTPATIILISAAVFLISLGLFRAAAGEIGIFRLNMLSYPFYLLMAFSFIGSILFAADVPFLAFDPSAFSGHFPDHAIRIKMWIAVMWMFVAVPTGAIFAQVVFRAGSMRRRLIAYRAQRIAVGCGLSEDALLVSFFIVGGGTLLLLLFRIWQSGEIPILNLVATGDILDTQRLRSQYGRTTGLADVVDSIFNVGLVEWMSYVAYVMRRLTHRLVWTLLFGSFFAVSVALSLYRTQVAPVFFYILGFLVVRSIIGGKEIRIREVVLGCALLVVLGAVFKGTAGNWLEVLENTLVGRVMIGQLLGFYEVFNIFPSKLGFIGMASTGRAIHGWFGMPTQESYGIISMAVYNPGGVAAGTAGHMTTIFMGEAWANFGTIGLIVAPLWVGAAVQAVNLQFLSRRKSALAAGLYGSFTTLFGYLSDLQGFYYPVGTLLFLVGVCSVVAVASLMTRRSLPANLGSTRAALRGRSSSP